jgi:uncharacterized protein
MRSSVSDKRLTEAELDRLDGLLERCSGGRAMNLEQVDGFLAALVCGPRMVMPSEYLPVVLGGELDDVCQFFSVDEANEILGLLMLQWNAIVGALSRDEFHEPFFFADEHGFVAGNDWALGFMQGVNMRRDDWDELMDFDTSPGYLFPMFWLCHEHDPDPELRPPTLAPEKREELVPMMAAYLLQIYRYFKPRRLADAEEARPRPARRAAKVGRNDPCPCGSGKKYKRCDCGLKVQ